MQTQRPQMHLAGFTKGALIYSMVRPGVKRVGRGTEIMRDMDIMDQSARRIGRVDIVRMYTLRRCGTLVHWHDTGLQRCRLEGIYAT